MMLFNDLPITPGWANLAMCVIPSVRMSMLISNHSICRSYFPILRKIHRVWVTVRIVRFLWVCLAMGSNWRSFDWQWAPPCTWPPLRTLMVVSDVYNRRESLRIFLNCCLFGSWKRRFQSLTLCFIVGNVYSILPIQYGQYKSWAIPF